MGCACRLFRGWDFGLCLSRGMGFCTPALFLSWQSAGSRSTASPSPAGSPGYHSSFPASPPSLAVAIIIRQ